MFQTFHTVHGVLQARILKWFAIPFSTGPHFVSHEIKRHLLLERKSRDITLPAKVHLVKAMVFLVVMYGCESWTTKKAECQRIDAFKL